MKKLLFVAVCTLLLLQCSALDTKYTIKIYKPLTEKNNLPAEAARIHAQQIVDLLVKNGYDYFQIALSDRGQHYYSSAYLNSRYEVSFMVDTGATESWLEYRLFKKYKLKKLLSDNVYYPEIKSHYSATNEAFPVSVSDFTIGSTTFKPWQFLTTEDNKDNVLGSDFLYLTQSVIIIRAGVVLFSINEKKADLDETLLPLGYTKVECLFKETEGPLRLTFKGRKVPFGNYYVPVSVGESSGYWLIDTGAVNSIVSEKFADDLGLQIHKDYRIVTEDAFGEKEDFFWTVASDIRIGQELLIDKMSLGVNPTPHIYSENKGVSGILGLSELWNLNAVIDFGNGFIYLKG